MQDVIQFLNLSIPEFQKLVRHRDRLISCLKQREFNSGSIIFMEGSPCRSSFLIREGEIKLLREKSTLEAISINRGYGKMVDTTLQTKRGFLSDSFSKFQLGIAIPGQWIGDDFLVVDMSTYAYTAIANTRVFCLELQKEEYDVIPKQILGQFQKQILERRMWILDRMKNVVSFVDKLMKTNASSINYTDTLIEKKRKLPLATIHAIDSIRKKEIFYINKSLQKISFDLDTPLCETKLPKLKKTQSKLRSVFRLNCAPIDNDSGSVERSISKYINDCTPLSYASVTKPLNNMFPIIAKNRYYNEKQLKMSHKSPPPSNSHQMLFQEKELNAFNIGKKTINLVTSRHIKLPTPNPYGSNIM